MILFFDTFDHLSLALNNKGFSLAQLGKYEVAIASYDKALAIDSNDTYALNNKGLSLDQLGKFNEAIPFYDKALAIDPNLTLALINKGIALGVNLRICPCPNNEWRSVRSVCKS